MGLFDVFKKKEESRGELTLENLQTGDLLEYFLKTWEVKKVYEYDWGNNEFTREYALDSGDDQVNLHISNDNPPVCSVSRKVSIVSVDNNLKAHIIKFDEPPQKVDYDGKSYYRQEEGQGYSREEGEGDDEWSEFVSWELVDDSGEHFISLERYGETDVDAYAGQYAKPFEFSNFLPRS